MFKQRSQLEELLDQDNIPKKDLFKNLDELEVINKQLGGHRATLIGLQKLIKDKKREYTIVDFACGGGDTLREVYNFGKKNAYRFRLIGFDLLADAVEYSKQKSKGMDIDFIQSDFKDFKLEEGFDIAINALCCHHFYGNDLNLLLKKMYEDSKIGVVINDLHRNPIAYYGIAILTQLLSGSYLVKHDAKLSVLKGFKKSEWHVLLDQLNIGHYEIKWIWAFRHLVCIKKS